MAKLDLLAKERPDTRKSTTKKLRAQGEIPATLYGKGLTKSISVKESDLMNLLRNPEGRHSLIDLHIDGTDEHLPVIIQAIQKNPLNQKVIHVDFRHVSLEEKVLTSVPIRIVGEAPGVELGGVLQQELNELEIKAFPDSIPPHIDVDVSHLNIGDKVYVSDIQLPEGVELVGPSEDTIVASVLQPSIQVEETTEEAEPQEEE